MEESEDNAIYKVVMNQEGEYSIWPDDRENPMGWYDAGKVGSKRESLDFIKEVWAGRKPISLNEKLEE